MFEVPKPITVFGMVLLAVSAAPPAASAPTTTTPVRRRNGLRFMVGFPSVGRPGSQPWRWHPLGRPRTVRFDHFAGKTTDVRPSSRIRGTPDAGARRRRRPYPTPVLTCFG